jgi:SpoVK/Ycf46/Vps4 family AAA+-type ATPase
LHYGDGFEKFHSDLMKRLDDESKGLVLFHGEPGTGKTQYIRHMLKELCGANKAVLYSPPAVSASLAEPQMINFISDWIMGEKRDCILLIEDAEPLLESRDGSADGRSTGISNLLNITDGILNDILGLMVIATFNIEISKIDSALLRPGRLLARKEFKKMDELQAENLAAALGIEKPETDLNKYPITLAEFYNNRKAKNILTHDWKNKERAKIGFSSGLNK